MSKYIAQRKLIYSLKGCGERKDMVVRISLPFLVDAATVNFSVDEDTAGCTVELDGLLEEHSETMYGADLLQALQLAVNIEPILERLSKKYDFYFPSGEPYFEPENND